MSPLVAEEGGRDPDDDGREHLVVREESWTGHINGSHVNKTTATSSHLNDAASSATTEDDEVDTEDHSGHARPPPFSPAAPACFARRSRPPPSGEARI
ncbi:Os09g0385800 [Oryza sativa Japonica Group]|uniref:Os09g0385800 protein n=1 Tax=Oryza sativa subsp. japonica TaxID=39947 RepID=A0A0P0XMP1_ORYSJ|nr:Os09g0385800 [Oryza sativa Japonica Group]